ncbi:MAG: oligosaccharide flippase family protein [Cellulophaga sp.]|nr:oligosaccharide flippase family protein [Cellulophaga sp.]
MGIVLKQSLNNTIITYIGFGFGAVNTIFLYTQFLTAEYYGLVGVISSASALLMPLLAFGVPNTLVKYFSSFKDSEYGDSFLTMMLFLPLLAMLPVAGIAYFANTLIGEFISRENAIVKDYVWYIFLIGMALAYFEVFYAWSRVQMKSVFGNFMKEVFVRIGIAILLLGIYFEWITVATFLKSLVLLYILRTIIMQLYAFKLRFPKIRFNFPKNSKTILEYSALIILGGSVAVVLFEMDRVMINQFIKIENVAYYSVAIFMATAIAVPSRAMHQITYPLTAEILNRKDSEGLKQLYHKSALTLFIIAGLLFVLIMTNINDLYQLLDPAYSQGVIVVFLIGLTKVYDAVLGNNNAILYNSDYYKALLMIGVFVAISAVLLNLWLIPTYGLKGAAYASFMALLLYNSIKIIFVKMRFGIVPFTTELFKVLLLLFVLGILFYFILLPFHPIVNIAVKSVLIVLVYTWFLYKFQWSEDIYAVLAKFFKR